MPKTDKKDPCHKRKYTLFVLHKQGDSTHIVNQGNEGEWAIAVSAKVLARVTRKFRWSFCWRVIKQIRLTFCNGCQYVTTVISKITFFIKKK